LILKWSLNFRLRFLLYKTCQPCIITISLLADKLYFYKTVLFYARGSMATLKRMLAVVVMVSCVSFVRGAAELSQQESDPNILRKQIQKDLASPNPTVRKKRAQWVIDEAYNSLAADEQTYWGGRLAAARNQEEKKSVSDELSNDEVFRVWCERIITQNAYVHWWDRWDNCEPVNGPAVGAYTLVASASRSVIAERDGIESKEDESAAE
jgi:hypothetical protein